MLYIIQADDNNIPVTELGYQTIEACNYYNWCNNTDEASAELMRPDNTMVHLAGKKYNKGTVIPVGSIEWVEGFLGKDIKPINIPLSLKGERFTGRFIGTGNKQDILKIYQGKDRLFIKSNKRCKHIVAQIMSIEELEDNHEYFYSEDISDLIDSEWRVFVQRGNILDCRMYIGDWYSSKPDRELVEEMVRVYKDCPPSYTLDVANINTKDGIRTVIIEVHNFISCGLYGFDNKSRILSMLSSSYKWEASLK